MVSLTKHCGFPPRPVNRASMDKTEPAIRDYCDKLTANVKDGKGLLMMGEPGTGKTCAMALIGQRALELQAKAKDSIQRLIVPCQYIRAVDLVETFFRDEKTTEYSHAPMLFIDDLGVEYQDRKGYIISKLEGLVDYRYSNELTTIVSTNLSPQDLLSHKDMARTVSRLRDENWMQTVVFKTNLRNKKEA